MGGIRRGHFAQAQMRLQMPLQLANVLEQGGISWPLEDQGGQKGLPPRNGIGQMRNGVLTEDGKCITVSHGLAAAG